MSDVTLAKGIVLLERYTRQGGSEMNRQNNKDTTCNKDSMHGLLNMDLIQADSLTFLEQKCPRWIRFLKSTNSWQKVLGKRTPKINHPYVEKGKRLDLEYPTYCIVGEIEDFNATALERPSFKDIYGQKFYRIARMARDIQKGKKISYNRFSDFKEDETPIDAMSKTLNQYAQYMLGKYNPTNGQVITPEVN